MRFGRIFGVIVTVAACACGGAGGQGTSDQNDPQTAPSKGVPTQCDAEAPLPPGAEPCPSTDPKQLPPPEPMDAAPPEPMDAAPPEPMDAAPPEEMDAAPPPFVAPPTK